MRNQDIFYWSPSLVKIATNQAVIQSASSIEKFDKIFTATIINFFGEFQEYKKEISENNVRLINYYSEKLFSLLPKHGFFQSRLSFLIIFVLGIIPLHNLIRKIKPKFLIIHLITSLPLFLIIFFKYDTKFILRISGFPKLNFLRKLFWKLSLKKVYKITCPTIATRSYLISLNIVDKNKIEVLSDPVLSINKINKLQKQKTDLFENNYLLAAGRLTKQKNFELLIEGFSKISEKFSSINLVIAGDGELKNKLKSNIKNLNLEKRIKLIGYKDNIYNYMKKSMGFVLTSLWEDPGFVLIEAAFCRSPIISSDCKNGPKEIIIDEDYGYIFKSGNLNSFEKKLSEFLNDHYNNKLKINNKKKKLLKKIMNFSKFRHYTELKKILEN